MLWGTQRTLTGVQPLVLGYWSGYQWYHDIRTTLSQRCTAECRVALRAVNLQKRQAFFVAAECDSCDLAFRGVLVLSCHCIRSLRENTLLSRWNATTSAKMCGCQPKGEVGMLCWPGCITGSKKLPKQAEHEHHHPSLTFIKRCFNSTTHMWLAHWTTTRSTPPKAQT